MNNVPVRIFDSGLNLLAEIDDYESLYYSRSWYGIGDWQMTINYHKQYASLLERGQIILPGTRMDSVGIIVSIQYAVGGDGKGSETITVSGRELKQLFKWRISYPGAGDARYEHQGKAETIIKNFVKAQCGATAAAARQYPLLTIATDQARGPTYLISARYSVVADELKDAANASHVSPTMTIDTTNKVYVFDVAEGVDRTAGQAVNARVIFSPSFDTLASAEIMHSDAEYRSIMVVGGQGVGAAREIYEYYPGTEPAGLDRREAWIDARDLADPADLPTRGAAKSTEYAQEDYIEGVVLTYSSLQYRTEWNLGDIVTVSAFSESTDARISAVRESWSSGEYGIEITFGKPFPTITDKVARVNSETSATLNANE